jgi:two-component system response regulator (stage 0 sporulation protein A)
MEERTNKRLKEILKRISKELKKLGISPKREGYWFLKDGISIYLTENNYSLKITKDIYPILSIKYNKKASAIEKAMRTSIEKGWTNCDLEYANEIFGNVIPYDKDRPTNYEFIKTVSEHILLEL